MKIDFGLLNINIELNNSCNKEYEICKADVKRGSLSPEDIMDIYINAELNENFAKNEPGTFTFLNKKLQGQQKGRKRFLEEFGLLHKAQIKIMELKSQKENIIFPER